jgi:hypothetical protein
MQCVLTPADPYMPKSNEEIAAEVDKQVVGRGCRPVWGCAWVCDRVGGGGGCCGGSIGERARVQV